MPVDPAFAELLADRRSELRPPPPNFLLRAFRAAAKARMVTTGPEVHSVEDHAATGSTGPVPIRLYRPTAAPGLPVIVFAHGGGFVLGDLDTHDALCRTLALETSAAVASIGYRLAPEARFPGPIEDVYAALAWVADTAGELQLDASRLALAGDSAGASLVLAAAMLARERGPRVAAMGLVYPVVDPRCAYPSMETFARGHLLTRDAMRWFWNCYLEDSADAENPLAAPLTANLAGLPPAIVLTAECDVLRDEGEALAGRLHAAGVSVVTRRYEGMIHGCLRYAELTPVAARMLADLSRELRAGLALGAGT